MTISTIEMTVKWSPGAVDSGLEAHLYGVEKLAFGHVGGGAANAPAC